MRELLAGVQGATASMQTVKTCANAGNACAAASSHLVRTVTALSEAKYLCLETRGSAKLGKASSALLQLRYGFSQILATDAAGRQKIVAYGTKLVKKIDSALTSYEALESSVDESGALNLNSLRESYKQYTEVRPEWFALQLGGNAEEAANWRARTTTLLGAATVNGCGDDSKRSGRSGTRRRAGAGFAVDASEVRSLVGGSADAAREMKALVFVKAASNGSRKVRSWSFRPVRR